MLRNLALLISKRFGWAFNINGEYVVFIDSGRIQLYVFKPSGNPIRRVYGFYATHFIENYEGENLKKELRKLGELDETFKEVVEFLSRFGFKLLRVSKSVGKFGDPHVSLFASFKEFEIVRELLWYGTGKYYLPYYGKPVKLSIKPIEKPKSYLKLQGWIDGYWLDLSDFKRIGLVRGLRLYWFGKEVNVEYEKLLDFEVRKIDDFEIIKIPYRVVVELSNSSKYVEDSIKVLKIGSDKAWATPIWEKLVEKDLIL